MPFLHIMRGHPDSLRPYQSLFEGASDNNSSLHSPLSLHKKILKFLFSSNCQASNSNSCKDIDVVFVSHLVNVEHLNSDSDFYFSDLPKYLKSRQVNCLIILINHTNESCKTLSKCINNSTTQRIVLSKSFSLTRDFLTVFSLIREMLVMKLTSFKENGLLKKILSRASSVKLLGGPLSSLIIGKQVDNILKLHNPKAIITTYEGHAWERVVYSIANQHNKKILRIGYQHAVVTKNTHSMARSLGEKCDPDLIFSSGKITHNFLKKSLNGAHSKFSVLGSEKSLGSLEAHNDKQNKTCLILPEGSLEECNLLFGFSIKCANKLPNIDFIWRLHPKMSFEQVLEYMSIDRNNLPKNIIISNLSLTKDIEKSSFALYRGTTAIIEAIYKGVFPIYLSTGSGMAIDFLYDAEGERGVVESTEGFAKVINDDVPHNSDKLINYCNQYFQPLEHEVLLQELKRVI